MLDEVFALENYNIFSDDNYYYFFRALNMADNNDLENGIITNEDGKIIKIRTDLERYEDIPKYTPDDDISLEQMVNHIKMLQRKDTNCISLTSNANSALTYGRGSYSDKYVMIKVAKNDINSNVYQAGLYMLTKIEKIITDFYQNGELNDIQKYYIDRIDNANSQEELDKIKNEIMSSGDTFNEAFQEGLLNLTSLNNYNSLNEQQNFMKNKTILKLDVLNKSVLKSMSNKVLIQAIGNAFSSLELIHYREVPESKITYIPSELMDIFGLIQQLPVNLENLEELKKELIIKSQVLKLNGKYEYNDFSIVENELNLDRMFNLTNGQVDYKTAYTMYKKAFYLCKSKLRTNNAVKLLKKIIGNETKYDSILNYISKRTFGIEPEITTRLSENFIKVSESVSLNFSSKEKELFEFINSLSFEESIKVMEDPFSTIKLLFEKFMSQNDDILKLSKEEWYANSIIDMLDLKRLGVVENLNLYQRRDIINKMLEFDFIDKYNYLKNQGYNNKTTIDLLFTSMIRETNKVSKKDLFTLEELENFIGYNKLLNTNFELRTYQRPVVENIDETFKTKKFTSAILPTGAGKSYVALSEMYKYRDKPILYLAPNNEILDHIVANIRKLYHPEEHIPDHPKDVIKKIFPNLELATYQVLREESAKELIERKYSLIVFDELHRTGASEWSKKVNELIDNQDDNVKVLGISATPERDSDLQNMADYWASKLGYTEDEIDMGNHLSANMDIITAMKCGYVCHPKVVCCEYSLIADGSYDEMKLGIESIKDPKLKGEITKKYEKSRREVEKADGIEKILADNLEKSGKYIIFLPVTRKKDGSFEDEDGNSISKTEASKIIKDYQMLMNQYLYSADYFKEKGEILNNIYEKIISNHNLENDELQFLLSEKENILLLSSFAIVSKPASLNTKNEIIADTIIEYMNWEKLDKKIMSKKLSKIMENEVENLSMLGSYSDKKNKQNLATFNQKSNGKKKFMFVMNKLNEGVHVDDIDGIVWLRPLDENSKILYLQQLGRCIFSITNDNYKRPTVIDLVNNTLKVNFEKGLTDIDEDIITISTIEQWVKANKRLPLQSSANEIEAEFAELLNSLNKKYIKYLDANKITAAPKENRNKIRKIIQIGTNIDLWNMATWTNQYGKQLNQNKTFLSFLGINPVVKDFLELKQDINKQVLKDFEFYFDLLVKLKEQGEDTDLRLDDKIRIKNDGTIEVVKRKTKYIAGKQVIINKDEYNAKDLIKVGKWLYTNQANFTEEQDQRLRDVGYNPTETKDEKFESNYNYLVKLKEQGDDTNLTKNDKIRVKNDGTIEVVKPKYKYIDGKKVIINKEEYNAKDLISVGAWLYHNQANFTEEQNQRLRDIGYIPRKDTAETKDEKFDRYHNYLVKLKEQGDDTNLRPDEKIRIKNDGTIEVVKRKTKYIAGKQVIINKEEYNAKDLILVGDWLYINQANFTEEQNQRLRDIGYNPTETKDEKFDRYYSYLVKLKEQGDDTNLTKNDKIRVKNDGTIEVVKPKYQRKDGKQEIINKEEYNAKDLILVGDWLYRNQANFTEEQKQRLRDIGYVLREDKKKKYNEADKTFEKNSHMKKVASNRIDNKENSNGRKLH